jgi:Zn-dependent protease with chaperone function
MEFREMRAARLLLLTAFLQTLVSSPASAAVDGHALEVVRQAIASPIPDSAIEQARRFDDQVLRTGMAMNTKVSLVTDERLQHTQAVVQRILTAIGERPQGWVVRLLDSDPKTVNAFVAGGKYIYVFTGLSDAVQSDDELAVVLGHEFGHSLLKHNLRQSTDLTASLATLANLFGQLKGGAGGANAMAIGKALHSRYSREDEREADSFGVLAAWRAGYDPLRGADFFTRLEQTDTQASAAHAQQLSDYKAQALKVKADCETWTQQWNSGTLPRTPQNANAINQRCTLYQQAVTAYNARIAQDANAAALAKVMDDHPDSQERIAAIAAETDWLHGARPLSSMQTYPRAYTVIVALLQTKNPIFAGLVKDSGQASAASSHEQPPEDSQATVAKVSEPTTRDAVPVAKADGPPPTAKGTARTESPFVSQWNALDDAYAAGVISKAEYDRKLQALLAKHRQ